MAKHVSKELYLKDGNSYIALGAIKAGRIKLHNNEILEIGSVEELFDIELSTEDKALMAMMKIGN